MNTIATPELQQGETYMGAIIKPDGTGHHVILIDGDKDDGEWQEALDWAKEKGGDLPSRIELSLMYAHSKDQFKKDWYWSNEEHASDSSCAWCQHFRYGLQIYLSKLGNFRARAVRRLSI